jgi:hypothetical protein
MIKKPISPWLLSYLELTTGESFRTGYRTVAKLRTCRCGMPILQGLDDHWCGEPADADVRPVTAAGEAWVRLGGRKTYKIVGRPDRYPRLMVRGSWDIEREEIGTPLMWGTVNVVPQHRCGFPVPEDLTCDPWA